MKKSIPKNYVGILRAHISLLFFISFLFIASSVSAQFQQPGGGIIMYDNCEKLPQVGWGIDFRQGYAMVTGGSQQVNNPDPRTNITLSSNYARKGNNSYRMQVSKRTDYPGCCQWVRSEVMWMSPSQQTSDNVWYWGSVSTLIDPSWQFEHRPTLIAFDTKSSPDDYRTPFGIEIRGDRYTVGVYNNGGENIRYDVGQVEKGKWVDWVVNRNWEDNSNGFVKVWKDGKLVVDHKGPNYRKNSYDAPVARIQHGLYKWVWSTADGTGWGEGIPASAASTPIIAYYDEIRFGNANAKLEDFLIDVAAPTPTPSNQAPTANAGSNQTITLPANSVNLNGSGNDPDGTVSSYSWTKVSGPAGGNIQSAGSAATQITGLNQGTYIFRLTVTDNGGATATDDVQIVVNAAAAPAPNQAPSASAGANKTITLPVNSVSFTGTANDSDGTIASWAWTKVSGPAGGTIGSPSSATTNITGLNQGSYTYRLTVTDNDGATGTDTVQVVVNAAAAPAPNQAPVANAGGNKTVTLPTSTVNLTGSATDADGSVSTYAWTKVSGPAGGNIQSADAAATNITGLAEGTYVFRLTVTDNDGATDTDDVQVTVNAAAAPAPNQAPVANAGGNKTITLPTSTVSLDGSATDADGSVSAYAWTKVSGPAGGSIQTAAAATTNITGLAEGIYVFRLTVTDNDGATDTDDVQVTVNAAAAPAPVTNEPPTAAAGSNLSVTLPTSAVTLNGSAADPDGKIVSYKWSKISGPIAGSFLNANAQSTGMNGLVAGKYLCRLTVTDDKGASASDSVQITVNSAPAGPLPPPNAAPAANAGANQTITLPVNAVTLNGVGTDTDGTIASFTWTKISGPATGTIVNANAQSTGVTGLSEGTYLFRLTVKDNDGAESYDDVQVKVNPQVTQVNQAPVANAGADKVITLPASTVTLTGTGSDADGSISSYAWEKISGPTGGNIAAATSASTSVSGLIQGVYVFRLTVKDNDGASSYDDVRVTVNAATTPANQAPVANAGSDIRITLPENKATLNGSSSSDADGSIVSYKWVMVKGPVTGTLANSNAATAQLTELVRGTYEFELTVTDNDGATATDIVTVTVLKNNKRPVAATTKDTINVILPVQNAELDASVSYDPDGVIREAEWKKVKGPGSPKFLTPTATKTIVTDLVAGEYLFNVTVTDDDDDKASKQMVVIVKNSSARKLIPIINLYPNPAVNNVTLTIDSEIDGRSDVTFIDIAGRPVLKETFMKNTRTLKKMINISNLAKGIYAVEIVMERAETVVRKVVKH